MAVSGEAKKVKESSTENFFVKFAKEIKAEVKRITWASKEEAKKAIAAVIVFTLIYVVYVAIVDSVFSKLYELIFK